MYKFETLNDETAILMLNQDTLTVYRWKNLIQNQLYEKLSRSYESRGRTIKISYFFYPELNLFDEDVEIDIKEIQLRFPPVGLKCQLLNFKTKQWQTGKIRILADVKMIWEKNRHLNFSNVEINKVTLEFASDQPTFGAESPLDEIRNSFSG